MYLSQKQASKVLFRHSRILTSNVPATLHLELNGAVFNGKFIGGVERSFMKMHTEGKGLLVFPMRGFSSYPDHIKLEMPNLSPTMEKGNIAKWEKGEGDKVEPGDILASIETDKATVDYEMQEEGYIAKLLFPEGAKDVPLGKTVAILVESKEDVAKFKDYSDDSSASTPPPKQPEQKQEAAPVTVSKEAAPQVVKKKHPERIFASPLARKLAKELNVDLAGLEGSGPREVILKQDVLAAAEQPQAKPQTKTQTAPQQAVITPQAGAGYIDLEVSQIRKVGAERLTLSKTTIPHYYTTFQVEMDKLLELRARLNAVSASKISVNDLVIKAASLACLKVPETNSQWLEGQVIRRFNHVNMSVAVQTEHGLMAPVVQSTHTKGLEQIATEVKDIATRARDNKLKPVELAGGTFTISNLGMYGVHNFSAIINPPQVCILAVSGTEQKVVPSDKEGEQFKVVQVMNATLSNDHRVVDGAIAAMWGQEFKKLVENPEFMLL